MPFTPRYWFHQPRFLSQRKDLDILIHTDGLNYFGTFYQVGGWLVSNHQATFGGFEMGLEASESNLISAIKALKAQANQKGLTGIKVTLWPHAYSPAQYDIQLSTWLASGFQVLYEDINYHIPVNGSPFTAQMHSMEARKLRRGIEAGLHCAQENTTKLVPEVLDLITKNREHRGYEISITESQLLKMLQDEQAFPLFTTRTSEGLLIACNLCIRIADEILYTFQPADDIAHRSLSPSVLQHAFIYEWCQEQGITLLDLGITGQRGVATEGLAAFKTRLGAHPSSKHTLHWIPIHS
jgi:hypothetical protein